MTQHDVAGVQQAVLDAAEALILESGFAATSIDAIAARAGVTKGALFHHFPSKAELARQLMTRYARRDADHLQQFLARAAVLSRDPLQQILIVFGLYEDMAAALTGPHPGCLFASIWYEARLHDDTTLQIVRDFFAWWRATVAAKFQATMAIYRPRLPVTAEELADMALAIAEGSFILSRVHGDGRLVAQQTREYRNYIELLFSPPSPSVAVA